MLIVEDQFLIADDLRRVLMDAGADVLGPSPNLKQAMQTLEGVNTPDFALLDINLDGDEAYSVARELQRRGTPFAFVTGYSRSMIPPEFRSAPYIEKPFEASSVVDTVQQSLPPAP